MIYTIYRLRQIDFDNNNCIIKNQPKQIGPTAPKSAKVSFHKSSLNSSQKSFGDIFENLPRQSVAAMYLHPIN